MTLIRFGTPGDLPAVEALRRVDGADLGFIPKAKYEHIVYQTFDRGRRRWEYESLYVATDEGDVTGFCLANYSRGRAKIEQICVRQDVRRLERAMRLEATVEAEAQRRWCPLIRCRVAFDIEANFFWRAVGYRPIATTTSTWLNLRESKSRRPLVVYEKQLQAALFQSPLVELVA
jgi:GNAT superfamily N-acetyltransferase